MSRRTVAAAAMLAVAVVALTGCDGSDAKSTGSTTTKPASASAWVEQWKPTLVSEYAPAQQALLSAIQSGVVVDVQAAAEAVVRANAALTTAIAGAGQPPESDAASAAQLARGLATEQTLIQAVLRTCTGSDPGCQPAVTSYGENNQNTIVPALTALRGAT